MNGAVSGGIPMAVLNMYQTVNLNEIHFDCAVYNMALGSIGVQLQEMGCKFYPLPLKSRYPIQYKNDLMRILSLEKYDVVHAHQNFTSYYPLWIAMKCGITHRIAHAHSNYSMKGISGHFKTTLAHSLLSRYATQLVACSEQAARSIFGEKSLKTNKLKIIKNCISTANFKYNDFVRCKLRKEMKLDKKIIIGCVGNLGKEKNLGFAIDILRFLPEKFILMIIGNGEEWDSLHQKTKGLNLADRVIFTGRKSNVNDFLQVFDLFLMPSLYEGFGIAALEAAASGLPILLSTNIPNDFKFYSQYFTDTLETGPKNWATKIENILNYNHYNRENGYNEVYKAGFDLSSNVDIINHIYGVKSL